MKLKIYIILSVFTVTFFCYHTIIKADTLEGIEAIELEYYDIPIEDELVACDMNEDNLVVYDINEKEDDIVYATTNLNMREECSTESHVLHTFKEGSKIHLIERTNDDWFKVIYNDLVGYVKAEYVSDEYVIKVESTAYYNKYNRDSASGRELIEGKSIAGKVAWLDMEVDIYECDSNGDLGELIGTFTFDDTGYGSETNVGQSKILPDKTIGTIENGTCIDFYMNTEEDCYEYGRKDVYLVFK